jgi:hypothetical protein
MGKRGPPPRSAAEHYRRGTYRRDRHGPLPEEARTEFPKLVSSWPRLPDEPEEPDQPSAAQRELLRALPSHLTKEQRRRYREAVLDAPWLEPIDLGLLEVWVVMTDMAETAGRELNTRLADPAFADPSSAVCKEGLLYSRLWHRYVSRAIEAADRLGFSPRGRRQLGID